MDIKYLRDRIVITTETEMEVAYLHGVFGQCQSKIKADVLETSVSTNVERWEHITTITLFRDEKKNKKKNKLNDLKEIDGKIEYDKRIKN